MWNLAIRLEPDHRWEHDASMNFATGVLLNVRSILDNQG
jgi:hypothetical protein